MRRLPLGLGTYLLIPHSNIQPDKLRRDGSRFRMLLLRRHRWLRRIATAWRNLPAGEPGYPWEKNKIMEIKLKMVRHIYATHALVAFRVSPKTAQAWGAGDRPRRLVINKMGTRELTAEKMFYTSFTPYWIHRQIQPNRIIRKLQINQNKSFRNWITKCRPNRKSLRKPTIVVLRSPRGELM